MFKILSLLSVMLLTTKLLAISPESAPSTVKVSCKALLGNDFQDQPYHEQEGSGVISAYSPQAIIIDDPQSVFEDDFYISFTYNLPIVYLPSGKKALTVTLFHKEPAKSTSMGSIQIPFDATEFSMTGFIKTESESKWLMVNCTIAQN